MGSLGAAVVTLLRDMRFACKALSRRPGYTVAGMATLGLATGVGFAAMMLADAILLRPLPLGEPHRVVALHRKAGEEVGFGFVYSEWEWVRNSTSDVFGAVAGSADLPVVGAAPWSHDGATHVSFVTEGFFDVVGIRPVLGRAFLETEYRAGADPVMVVTHAFWRSQLGGDRNVIGRRIEVGRGTAAVVVGILPAGFRGLRLDQAVDAIMPLRTAQLVWPARNLFAERVVDGYSPERWIAIVARLRDGVTADRAGPWLATMLQAGRPGTRTEERIGTTPAMRAALSDRSRRAIRRLFVLLGAMSGLVLLVGCASVAGALLVRNRQRRREIAIRVCMGAGRVDLARLCLAETLLLAGAGSLFGGLVAVWLVQAVVRHVALPGGIEIAHLSIGWTTRVAAAGGLVFVTAAVIAGMAPALQSMRWVMQPRGPAGRGRKVVLAGQLAAVTVVMTGASLAVRDVREVMDTGLDMGRLLYVDLSFWRDREHRSAGVVASFYDSVVERLRDFPGIEAVTFGDLPLTTNAMSVREVEADGEMRRVPKPMEVFFCGSDYVRAVGLTVVRGRDFESADRGGGVPVAIVTESLARYLWGEDDPMGRRLEFLPLTNAAEVVGVARDGRYGSLGDAREFAVFLPWRQNRELASATGAVIVRAEREATALVPTVRGVIRALAPDVPVRNAGTLQDRMENLTRPQRAAAAVLGGLGVFVLLLAVVGVYGAVAYTIAGRRRELGIRIALGAGKGAVVGTVLRETLAGVGVGVAAGVGVANAGAALAMPVVGVSPHDGMAQAMAIGTVVVVAISAGLVPTFRLVSAPSVEKLIKETTWAE